MNHQTPPSRKGGAKEKSTAAVDNNNCHNNQSAATVTAVTSRIGCNSMILRAERSILQGFPTTTTTKQEQQDTTEDDLDRLWGPLTRPITVRPSQNTSRRIRMSAGSRREMMVFVFLLLRIISTFTILPTTHAFPTYLLSRSNCWTELSTTEVIMNHPVTAWADSDDTDMRLELLAMEDSTLLLPIDEHGVYTIDAPFPVTVQVRVVTTANSATSKDYQWAMDVLEEDDESDGTGGEVGESASGAKKSRFDGGSCPGETRVTGRATDVVQVTIETEGASIVAGWAAGMEEVRLTKPVVFRSSTLAAEIDRKKEDLENPETGPEHISNERVDGADEGNGQDINSEKIAVAGPDPPKTGMAEPIATPNQGGAAVDPQKVIDQAMRDPVNAVQDQLHQHRTKLESREGFDNDPDRTIQLDHKVHDVTDRERYIPTYKEHSAHESSDWAKERLRRDRYSDANRQYHRKNLSQYQIGFHPDVHQHDRLSIASYLQGVMVLVGVTAAVIYICLWISQRPDKKRRKL